MDRSSNSRRRRIGQIAARSTNCMEQLTEQQRQEIKRKRREALAKRQQILAGRGKQGNGQVRREGLRTRPAR